MSLPFKFHSRMSPERQELLSQIMWTLALDGPFEDANGFATADLVTALAARGVTAEVTLVSQLLAGLEEGGRYNQEGVDAYVEREINGKRCYSISLVQGPKKVPFPKNPFRGRKAEAEPAVTEDEPEIVEFADIEMVVEAPAGDLVQVAALSTYDDSSVHDKLLYAISLLNDANLQLAKQPASDFAALVDGRLEAANRLLADNDRLRSEIDGLRNENRVLRRANDELQRALHTIQGQLAGMRSSNGSGLTSLTM
jgi:hypothetical protein